MTFFFPNLADRLYVKELMDDPQCDQMRLLNTIRQFRLLNRLFTGSRRMIKKHIIPHLKKNPEKEFTLMDLGAGGCDLDRWLIDLCRRKGWKLKITALDYDHRIVKMAERMNQGYPEITLIQGSALELEKYGEFDFMFTNHMLHHLDFPDIAVILQKAFHQTRVALALNDIRRSNLAYLGYTIFTGLFLHKSFTFIDGRLSIRRGFKVKEILELIGPMKKRFPVCVTKTEPGHLTISGCISPSFS